MHPFLVLPLSVSLLAAPVAPTHEHGETCDKPGHACEKTCDKPVQACLDEMITKLKTTGFIGVEVDKDRATGAMRVTKVIPGTPAEKVGIREGDELVAFNGIRFSEENEAALSKVKVPGAEVTCTIRRDGANREMKVTLVPMPADLMAKYIGEHMMMHAKNREAPPPKK